MGQARAEELVGRCEQVVDILARRLDVVDVALVVIVGGADQAATQPRKREDRPALPGGNDRPGRQRQSLG